LVDQPVVCINFCFLACYSAISKWKLAPFLQLHGTTFVFFVSVFQKWKFASTRQRIALFPSSVENCVFFCHLFFWRHDDFFVKFWLRKFCLSDNSSKNWKSFHKILSLKTKVKTKFIRPSLNYWTVVAIDTIGESSCFFLVIFGQGYQRWKLWFFLVIFGQGYQWWKLLFFIDIFGQGYFYWPLRLWIPMMKAMFVIWDFEQPLASRSAKREFAFVGGNLWHPTVQAGVRAPGGNCWHGIASTSILVHR